MIEVTIKTLDSRNHAFTVGDEFTVKQLKEHIAESVSVPADSQRLIYCGRVLVDDKKLSEYDVNGKVIHLVQRAPPSSSSDTGNSGSEPRTSSRRPFRATFFNQGSGIRVDGAAGNAMYLGAMAFPADLMDAQGARHLNNRINLPNPRHVSQSRLAVVRSFIRRARLVMQYLENPLLSTTPPEADNSPPATAQAPAPMNFAFLAQALSDAVSRAAGNLTNSDATPVINVEVLASNENGHTSDSSSEPPTQPSEEAVSGETEPTAAQMENPPLMPPLILSPPEAEASTTFPPSSADEPSNNGQESDQRPQRSRFSRPSALADLVSQAMGVHTRLQPFLDRYYELLREDAPLETPQQAQQAQHLFNSVSELLHLMAHAYHAISDVMCDFSQSPPRLLQCRPVLIHHSAVLQTGIPIQVNLGNASQSRGTATGSAEADRGSEDAESDNNGNAPDLGEAAAQAATLSAEPRLSRRDMAEVERTLNEAIRRRERSDRTPTPPREQRQARAFNISGGLEFIMDIGQGSVHIDSVEASVIPGSGAATAPSGDASGNAPSPELLNLWHALGHVTNLANRISNAPAPATTAPTTASSGSTAENNSTAPNPNNNGNANTASSSSSTSLPTAGLLPGVQAWTNTETQPTTSTQTRATTRPHVHISPGLQGIGMPGFFDPFLPCSSHHLRSQFRRSQNQSDQENSQTQTGAQRAGASTENGANATNFPSSAGVPPHNHRGIRITPDVTFVVQAPSRVSMEFPSASPLLIDMMVSSNAEGTSLYSDMFLTLARHLHVHEVRDLNFRHILTRARPHLATFFRDRLTQGRDDMEGITEGVNRFITDIRPLLDAALDSFDDIPMREDVDILASINLVNSFFLPRLVDIIINADSDHICYLNFRKFWMDYVHILASIFHFCCLNGESDADNAFMRLGVRFLNAIPGLAIWAGYRVHRTVRQLLSELTPNADSVQDFIVYRMASGPVPATSEPSVATAAVTPPPMEVVPPQPVTPQPMDVEDTVVVAEQLTEELPDVILDVHPDWVPIISRDRERQRRQAVQGPLSDAYLSGMPSKRRKIVTSNKPQGSLSKIITESLSTAITAAGVPVVENVLEAVASDSSVEDAYKEQLRNTLGSTAKAHPDFKPDKYPNSNKLFSSSK